MNKDERKYVAKRIADEAQLASAQVKTVVPDAREAYKAQFEDLSQTDAFELFELNLPATTKEQKLISREVKTDSSGYRNYGAAHAEDIKYSGGDIVFSFRGDALLEDMQTLKHFQTLRTKDIDRVTAIHDSIRKLRIDATDQVLLGSAPEALAALGDFITAVNKLVPA